MFPECQIADWLFETLNLYEEFQEPPCLEAAECIFVGAVVAAINKHGLKYNIFSTWNRETANGKSKVGDRVGKYNFKILVNDVTKIVVEVKNCKVLTDDHKFQVS